MDYIETAKNIRKNKNGYVVIKVDSRWVLQHRFLMELKIGRKLKSNEAVHHINGIKDDNRIENLKLVENSEHATYQNNNSKKKSPILSEKNFSDWTSQDFWQYTLDKYKISKLLRKICKEGHGFNYIKLSNKIGYSRQYIYHVLKMKIDPSKDFLDKIQQIGGEQWT